MSQVVTRKSAISEEKEKRTDSPVKDMKKKVAANAEKEKQATEKPTEKQPDKSEKPKQVEKPAEKSDKPKPAEKPAEKSDKPKQVEKPSEKHDKQKLPEKPTEKNEKQKQPEKATEKEKPAEKGADKTDKKVEKNGVENKKTEKKDTQEKKDDKADKSAKADTKKAEKSKQNGSKHNGVETNGVEEAASDDDVLEIADDEFPELAYEDSDNESPTPDNAPGRSATRRSQVKAARTPETPQPAASAATQDKASDIAPAEPKDSKVLKLTEAPPCDRKLRSDDSKPDKKDKDSKTEEDARKKENGDKDDDVIEIDADEEPRKTDTNYSKSRVKVSPYRRSTRLADQTTSSVAANYTGNNTTMEMDITESSFDDVSLDDSSYLSGLRTIRGRRSYKPLKELTLKHVNRSARSANISVSESTARPTGTVVGRKRKPDAEESTSIELIATEGAELSSVMHTKRMKLLDRIAQPFRRTLASTPLPARRNPEIVGINTDLPLTAPVASPDTFDPESLKTSPAITLTPPTPAARAAMDDVDKKRCIVM